MNGPLTAVLFYYIFVLASVALVVLVVSLGLSFHVDTLSAHGSPIHKYIL